MVCRAEPYIRELRAEKRQSSKMDNLLEARIQKKMNEFSKGQKRIAGYIEENYDKVAFMTASKLGATVGVSESTVVRFATEIGYDGYPQLQQAMQEMIRNKLTTVQRMDVTSARIGGSDVLDFVFNQDIDVIRRTMEETSHKDFYRAVDAIVASRKIYILAARSALALGTFLFNYLNMLFENVLLVQSTSEGEIFEQMIHINGQDTVIGISFPRYSRKVAHAMDFARNRSAKVIAITDTSMSPIAEKADYLLLARSDIASIVDSLCAPLSLINALIVMITIKKSGEVKQTFQSLEDIWDEYGVYEKVDEAVK
jgi:DNA-binding MurR/RpiR family transcriptional regulator